MLISELQGVAQSSPMVMGPNLPLLSVICSTIRVCGMTLVYVIITSSRQGDNPWCH